MSKRPQSQAGEKFERLTEIMAQLRAPDGCPWDRKQTLETIKPYLLEETYEVLDAIDASDTAGLREELGDLMLEAVFLAQIADDEGKFRVEDSLDAINEKLVRRHPHIFAGATAETPEDVVKRWDEIKAEEKKQKDAPPQGLLDSVPRSTPALVEAAQITSRAARAGFDWPNIDGVFEKLDEELGELHSARNNGESQEAIEGELGDLLFVLVNLARFLKVDPEQALRKTNRKFRQRFGHVEQRLKENGREPAQASLEEMEALWQEAKQKR